LDPDNPHQRAAIRLPGLRQTCSKPHQGYSKILPPKRPSDQAPRSLVPPRATSRCRSCGRSRGRPLSNMRPNSAPLERRS